MNLESLLKFLVAKKGTDLFLNAGAPPMVKIFGSIRPISKTVLTANEISNTIASLLSQEQTHELDEKRQIDLGITISGAGRFRLNIYHQKGDLAIVARHIISKIPSLEALNLPLKLQDLANQERGLILVVGATGTGKSTTLASMLNYRNQNCAGHILTIEDPIEFIHNHNKSLISQREIGIDALSYEDALTSAMRESPDAILIGECRDRTTMRYALSFAATGHLCLSTVHANNARQAIDRVVNFFPHDLHQQVRNDLSEHLKAVICQRLPLAIDGGRVPAVEIMMCTPYVQELIREGDIDKIQEVMIEDNDDGSQTFDQALYGLFIANQITEEEALKHADSKDNLKLMMRFGD